jgi:hypothetical protein
VLLEPDDALAESWREGRGLPRGVGIDPVQTAFPGLAELLNSLQPGEPS